MILGSLFVLISAYRQMHYGMCLWLACAVSLVITALYQIVHCPKIPSLSSAQLQPHQPLIPKDHFYIFNNSIQLKSRYVSFLDFFSTYQNTFKAVCSHLVTWLMAHLFLSLNTIPLYLLTYWRASFCFHILVIMKKVVMDKNVNSFGKGTRNIYHMLRLFLVL